MRKIISGKTSLVGLLGKPVQHSLSPVIHNAAFAEMGLNWCYLAFPCKTEALTIVLNALNAVDCRGLNITIPHKQTVAKTCNELSVLAQRLNAVNTLTPTTNGHWKGGNTDVEGFESPLKNLETAWTGRAALVIGCGGSAKAVIAGLENLNFKEITVVGRRIDAVNHFLEEVTKNPYRSQKDLKTTIHGCIDTDVELIDSLAKADLIINATPIGMNTNDSEKLISTEYPLGKEIWQHLKRETVLYDLVYNPRPTPWLTWGTKQGHQCIDGLEMLIQQGAASLRLWSGIKDIPISSMRKAANNALKN